MEKKTILAGFFFTILFAVIVYAWASDSGGGYNPTRKGTCSDQFGNHTDICLNGSLLEFYPATNNSWCSAQYVNCAAYFNGTGICYRGACVDTGPY